MSAPRAVPHSAAGPGPPIPGISTTTAFPTSTSPTVTFQVLTHSTPAVSSGDTLSATLLPLPRRPFLTNAAGTPSTNGSAPTAPGTATSVTFYIATIATARFQKSLAFLDWTFSTT